ncbi:SGNH/GDSL hydrolase family protein [Methylobacterium sp.]|uniref:SGNH/GDSL hydrolase family protein n=1 Tax=Methylobacterium sp. TaxID=409 RepID=UPI003B009773
MDIIIAGGSNSILRNGYIKQLTNEMRRHFADINIRNISAGGTTSISMFSRLAEIGGRADLIIFEYSLNDTGHINHLPDPCAKRQIFLDLFFHACTRFFPEARVLPVILSSKPFYNLSIQNYVYIHEISYYKNMGINFVDARQALSDIFGDSAPDLLYSDVAHFHQGIASALLGNLIAAGARLTMATPRSIRAMQIKSVKIAENIDLLPVYESSRSIIKSGGLNVKSVALQNRHVSVEALEIRADQTFTFHFNGWPICLYFASDTYHGCLRMRVGQADIFVETRHIDTIEGKFLFTSIPLLLNESYMKFMDVSSQQIVLSLANNSTETFQFDCFERSLGSAQGVKLIGILGLKAQS